MIFQENKRLFTIAEVSKACGISRTSLIRLEESGFFKPYHIDKDTGYRYYDVTNIVEIGRYKRLRAIGLTRSEISDYYHERIDLEQFVEAQRKKLNALRSFINQFELRNHRKKYTHSMVTLPGVVCRCIDITPSSFREAEVTAFVFYENLIAEGFQVIPDQPPLFLYDNWKDFSGDSPLGCRYTVCIPVLPTSRQMKETDCLSIPASEALSTSGSGGYDILPDLIKAHYAELDKEKKEIAGRSRLMVYSAHRSEPGDYIFEFISPVI